MKVLKFLVLFFFIYSGISCKDFSAVEMDNITPKVGDYYVSISGNDLNPGTELLPWRTIQKAANTIAPGKIAVVKPGYYDEYVVIKTNGSANDLRIKIVSETPNAAKCIGFNIQTDYVTIDGFDIEANTHNWIGITINGRSNVEILNCYVHECPMGGIYVAGGAVKARIVNNKLEHNGQWGIKVIGHKALIEGNEITRTVQYHPKGMEHGFTGADADGMRIFGDQHIIRANKIINIADPNDKGNIDPHADCIQTWDGGPNGLPIMTNTVIEDNYFSVEHPSGKGILIDANKGNACHHLIIRNNIFEFCDIGISAYSGKFHDISILNNTFNAYLNQSSWGTSMYLKDVINYNVQNNITVDCHPEHRKIIGGSGIVDYNLAWNSDGSTPVLIPGLQKHELKGLNPKFRIYTGVHGNNDFHLLPSSPAINVGEKLDEVTIDFDSIPRPQGSSFDIGAFEFKPSK